MFDERFLTFNSKSLFFDVALRLPQYQHANNKRGIIIEVSNKILDFRINRILTTRIFSVWILGSICSKLCTCSYCREAKSRAFVGLMIPINKSPSSWWIAFFRTRNYIFYLRSNCPSFRRRDAI